MILAGHQSVRLRENHHFRERFPVPISSLFRTSIWIGILPKTITQLFATVQKPKRTKQTAQNAKEKKTQSDAPAAALLKLRIAKHSPHREA